MQACVTSAYESDGDLSLVAEIDGKVVGFALGSTLERTEVNYGYLIWLAVDSGASGMGLGTLLYETYEALIRENHSDIKTIIIDTQASNFGAIKFFSRLGFVLTDTFIYITKKPNEPLIAIDEAMAEVLRIAEAQVLLDS